MDIVWGDVTEYWVGGRVSGNPQSAAEISPDTGIILLIIYMYFLGNHLTLFECIFECTWPFRQQNFTNPAGNFYADKGLESGLSVPIFQYFRSRNSLMCH